LRIEEYFDQVRKEVEVSPIIHLLNVTYEKRGTYEGVVRGRAYFIDKTVLEWREYIDVERTVDRLMYAYQYMDRGMNIIFRYDNTGHYKKLGLATYPHHKHTAGDSGVVASDPMDLTQLLQEIESMVQFP
jgi:hypothetical protein